MKPQSGVTGILNALTAFLACAVLACTSSWPLAQTQATGLVAQDLPTCIGPFTCDGEMNMCRAAIPGRVLGTFTFTDSGYSVRSDGRGPYVNGKDGVLAVATVAIVLAWRQPQPDPTTARYISVDLNHPVPNDISKPLGVIRDDYAEVATQWYADPGPVDSLGRRTRLQHSATEIPVGTTVEGRQVNIGIHINGRYHILQLGPQPTGHCFAEGTAIFGDGTTQPKISRLAENRWLVEAPPGSIGRLFDTYHTNKYAINKGRYYVSFRYVLEK